MTTPTGMSVVFLSQNSTRLTKLSQIFSNNLLRASIFGFAIGIVLVNSVPRRTTGAWDRSKDRSGNSSVPVVRIFGIHKPGGGCSVNVFSNACGDAVSRLIVPLGVTNEGVFAATPFDDVSTPSLI